SGGGRGSVGPPWGRGAERVVRRPAAGLLIVASVPLVVGVLFFASRSRPTPPVGDHPYLAATVAVGGGGDHQEALQLYAAGQFPGACERFSRAADDDPRNPVWRQDVARCFEGWGRDGLTWGRPEAA